MNKQAISNILWKLAPLCSRKEIEDATEQILTAQEVKSESLDTIARVLIKYLCDNYHPHVEITITPTGYELKEGLVSGGQILDYIKD